MRERAHAGTHACTCIGACGVEGLGGRGGGGTRCNIREHASHPFITAVHVLLYMCTCMHLCLHSTARVHALRRRIEGHQGVALDDLVYIMTQLARQAEHEGFDKVFGAAEAATRAIEVRTRVCTCLCLLPLVRHGRADTCARSLGGHAVCAPSSHPPCAHAAMAGMCPCRSRGRCLRSPSSWWRR